MEASTARKARARSLKSRENRMETEVGRDHSEKDNVKAKPGNKPGRANSQVTNSKIETKKSPIEDEDEYFKDAGAKKRVVTSAKTAYSNALLSLSQQYSKEVKAQEKSSHRSGEETKSKKEKIGEAKEKSKIQNK